MCMRGKPADSRICSFINYSTHTSISDTVNKDIAVLPNMFDRFVVIFWCYVSDFLDLMPTCHLVSFMSQKQHQIVSNIKRSNINQCFSSVELYEREWGPLLHTFFLFLHVLFIFLFMVSAFLLFCISILTRAAAPASHQHQCLRSAGRVTRVGVCVRVCVRCKNAAFHVFIFHHCKWSVLDSAGCNYELLSVFRHTQLHSEESLGDVIISVMAQRCHPPHRAPLYSL